MLRKFWFVFILILSAACTQIPSLGSRRATSNPSEGIIFASDRSGKESYYLMNTDGSDVQIINLGELPTGVLVDRPIWSGKHNRYIFSAVTDLDSDIYSVRSDGQNLVNLTSTPDSFESNPVLSPDEESIAFIRTLDDPDIYLMNIDGSKQRNITNWADRYYGNPTWTNDSSRLFLSSIRAGTPNIFSIDIPDIKLNNISKGKGLDGLFSLSPDNKQMVFDSDRAGSMDLFVINLDSGEIANLTNSPKVREVNPLWSPDGKRIAFFSDQDGGSDIFILSLDDNSIVNLTKTPEIQETTLSWAPDSQHLMFVSSVGEQSDIFLIRIDGSVPVNLTNHPANDYGASWLQHIKK